MKKQKLVLVGNGMAGVRTLEELLKLAPDLYDITVFGAEPHPNYNRILLSPVLAGEQALEQIILNDLDWYASNNIRLHLGKTVTRIDRKARTVQTACGIVEPYDRLLLATGSVPFILPIPGKDLPGVISYRDIKDTNEMIEAATAYRNAVVIGGGLLGLEAANGLKARGMNVTVVHLAGWLMERQLDPVAAGLLQKNLEDRGLTFMLETATEALLPNADGSRVARVRFKDGQEIDADLVVMAAGIKPNTALAESARIHCARGIVVNDTMQTFDPLVYAVGECVNHRGTVYGLVAPLFEQAKVCANHLAEYGIGRYSGSVTSTKLKVTGVDLFSAGDFMGGDACEEITLSDPLGGVYRKLVVRDDKLVGACIYGDTADGTWYFKLLREQKSIADIRDTLIFGETNIGDAGHEGHNKAAAMADTDEVCGCNGVSKGRIVRAIKEEGIFTLDEVRKCTKASGSCGSCTGLVEQILMNCLGTNYSETPLKKAMCGCTEHSHEDVRVAIREHKYLSQPQIREAMGWRTPNGCASCRPALNYYLISTWPGEAADDPQSRFINERAHANIQKDGTYSVVPRMWGGLTNASELRRIADVAEKFNVPTVKVTGGQRIDLLGIKKEDLPAVWHDLGKLAVSGCPRNCAESGIKDVGVIGVDSGWEIHVAGNGGIKTEVAQFLCKVKTDDEVREYSGAFIQLYREEGWYLERTVHYVNRVGMDYVRRRILEDAAGRQALFDRLLFALKDAPDPWKDFARAGVDLRQFQPIAVEPVVA